MAEIIASWRVHGEYLRRCQHASLFFNRNPHLQSREDEMTPEELYRYDVYGYLLIENAIDLDQLDVINGSLDRWEQPALKQSPDHNPMGKIDDILNHEPSLVYLVANPPLVPYIDALVDRPRLKSTWVSFQPHGGYVGGHSNHTPAIAHNYYYYHDRICHNLLQVFYACSDISLGGGALQLIPGSHKANFPLPDGDRQEMLVEIPMTAGSALLFSHDTYHTSCNHSDTMRRTLIFTYCPGIIANSFVGDCLYDSLFESAPEETWQKYLLRRPHGFLETYSMPPSHPSQHGTAA